MPTANLLQESVLPNVRDRFRREARNGKNLSHPNIVRYLDLGQYEKVPFLVMELAKGTVAASIQRFRQLSESDAADVVKSCLNGLEYLHGKGSPHRDVKPANILEFSGGVKLGDLGIVKWSDYDPALLTAAQPQDSPCNWVLGSTWHPNNKNPLMMRCQPRIYMLSALRGSKCYLALYPLHRPRSPMHINFPLSIRRSRK